MVSPSFASRLWCYSKGRVLGTVEAICRNGFIFSNADVRLRVTSSNVAHGEVHFYSIEGLPQVEVDRLSDAMRDRRIVAVHVEEHVLGLPGRGDICTPGYVKRVDEPL